ncbi:MAG: enoyl-CoA hydratase [Thermosulfidibacteraceae bacterium]|jgi:enoyl-CoA hydratase/carnithine racemase
MRHLIVDERNNILLVTLNRPEVHNAICLGMLHELSDVLEKYWFDKKVRALIITGSGEKAFCAGADLKERISMSEDEVRVFIRTIRDTFTKIEDIPKPVICAMNGVAFGGGLELALACDLRIAAKGVLMGLTETSLAIIPGAGGTQRLPRIVGISKAKELIYLAKRITAEEAMVIGLVNEVVERERLLDRAFEIAREIAKKGPIAISQAKYAINRGYEVDIKSGLEIETKAYEVLIPTKDRLEGLKAFMEKREPNYKGE